MSVQIILADCASAYRSVVATEIKELDVEVVEVDSGSQAIEAIEKGQFEIAIVDNYLVERFDGELLARIKETDASIKLVLIVEPSFDFDLQEVFSTENKIAKLVKGPVHPKVLRTHVETLLSIEEGNNKESMVQRRTSSPPDATDESVESQLVMVRRSYQEKLPGELVKLEKALSEARNNPERLALLNDAHRLAHTLHGTAGTLGFAEVASMVERIDIQLKQIIGNGTPADESVWTTIFQFLEQAQTAPERSSLVVTTPVRVADFATILVMDADARVLDDIGDAAQKNLINSISVTTIEEGLIQAQQRTIDGALIDIHFGGQHNSFQVAQELRKLNGLSNLPVAIMSNDSSVLNRVTAAHAGASQFVHKPLSAEDLMEIARSFSSARASVNSKILIVDDDEYFGAHVKAILEGEGLEIWTLSDPEQVLDVLGKTVPDIILLDVMMPKISGFDVCRMLRSSNSWQEIPILFLTAESSAEVRLECFRSGGDDYIEKPVIKEELLARIGVRLERIRFFKERADKDGLTGLPNRRAFLDLFKLRVSEGKRFSRPVSLCVIDLDKFKYVNDTYGHLAGDRVLIGMGKLLSSRFRDVDLRGRWGGEEFAVVFYGEEAITSQMILNRILNEFKQLVFEGDHDEKFHVTFSCGIATYPRDGSTFDELFRSADEKLYKAKELGRNRIEI